LSFCAPFAIEADTPNNSDIALQSILGCKLRTSIGVNKPVKNTNTGAERIPKDQSIHLGMLPTIPGMQLFVDPADCSYRIVDPLHKDEKLCERIRLEIEARSAFKTDKKLKGIETQRGTLDVHRMKTLCRELLWFLDSGEAKLVKGIKPKLEDIDKLPGKYLQNPGCRVPNLQPRYEDDYDKWLENLAKMGG